MRYILFFITIVSFSGCSLLSGVVGNQNEIIGSWRFKDFAMSPLTLTFYNDRTFSVDYNADGIGDITGQYEFFLGAVKFFDDDPRGSTACYEAGFYYYRIEGQELHFTLLIDQCKPRKNVLSYVMTRVR